MKLRALAIDLDGTLLSPDEKVSPRNRRAIAAARKAGLSVVIATARWYQNAERVARELALEGPVIACSGAEVRLLPEGRDLLDERMPEAFATELFGLCDEERCVVYAALDERVLLKMDGEADPSMLLPEMVQVPELVPAMDAAPRIVMVQGRRARARVRETLESRWRGRVRFETSLTTQGTELLNLTATQANKGDALRIACRALDISPDEVAAFGDAENDIELFSAAGTSFAMGQASARVKAAATHVTAPNAEDGVAQAIEGLI